VNAFDDCEHLHTGHKNLSGAEGGRFHVSPESVDGAPSPVPGGTRHERRTGGFSAAGQEDTVHGRF